MWHIKLILITKTIQRVTLKLEYQNYKLLKVIHAIYTGKLSLMHF